MAQQAAGLVLLLILMETRLLKAGPALPIQVSGFETLPEVGDFFEVVPKSEFRRQPWLCRKRSLLQVRDYLPREQLT